VPDIVAIGEPLVDFISMRSGVSLLEADTFQRSVGGGPANMTVGMARLGASAGLIGKIGDDTFGYFLAKALAENGVDVTCLYFDPRARTALAFATLDAQNRPDFTFYRQNSAGKYLRPEDIDEAYIAQAKVLVFSALSLIAEPCRSATLAAAIYARRHGVLVAYDPQLRLTLWPSAAAARRGMQRGWVQADIVKANSDEIAFLREGHDLADRADHLWTPSLKLLAVTLGPEGCWYRTSHGQGQVAGVPVRTVDTTGAGDAFMAGLLVRLLESTWPAAELSRGAWEQIFRFANAVAALTTTNRGVIQALPDRIAVDRFLVDAAGSDQKG
jgi:fructokinase